MGNRRADWVRGRTRISARPKGADVCDLARGEVHGPGV
jgi:hypothetical protein